MGEDTEPAGELPPEGDSVSGGEEAEVPEGPDIVVRTLRFEITWPGWRRSDLHALFAEIWKAEGDLRRAGNRALTALYQLKMGVLPWPEGEGKKGKNKGKVVKKSLQGLCYQCLSGAWQPFGEPMYQPTTA